MGNLYGVKTMPTVGHTQRKAERLIKTEAVKRVGPRHIVKLDNCPVCSQCGGPDTRREKELTFGGLTLYRPSVSCKYLDQTIRLSLQEFAILWKLVSRAGSIAPIDWLMEETEATDSRKVIHVTVHKLNKKLGRKLVFNAHGVGYFLLTNGIT